MFFEHAIWLSLGPSEAILRPILSVKFQLYRVLSLSLVSVGCT